MTRKNKVKTTGAACASDAPLHRTHAQLAEAVGVDRSTITRRLRADDCPIARIGPWDDDDTEAFGEWIGSDSAGGDGGDDLKRAQSVKAKVLAAKYLLEMAISLGKVGAMHAELMLKALPSTTTVHWQATRFKLGDFLRERGGVEAHQADAEAERFARWFYDEWARTFERAINFHAQGNDESAAVARRIRKLVGELEIMPDMDSAMIAEIRAALDQVDANEAKQ
jgi:hypothetical protein